MEKELAMKTCDCCELELNAYEIKLGEGKCCHCLKGNCEICGEGGDE